MGNHAVLAVKQSCAHQNNTDVHGNKVNKPFSLRGIPKDSVFYQIKDSPELTSFSNAEIVEVVHRKRFPDWTFEDVKTWLIKTNWEDAKPRK